MNTDRVSWLFLDLNSYFASVEQQLHPRLRGRPIAIVPVAAQNTCCIAVSYEARRFGIRTGCSVSRARELCPELELVESRPKLYVEMHHKILTAIKHILPVESVLSCDEFACTLTGSQCNVPRAQELAQEIKRGIRQHAGSTLRCSIGLGPNRLLAKIAADMVKPDGLVTLTESHLPHALFALPLLDIPGIGERMERRLLAAGITTVQQLCLLSRERMASLWGGVLGERLWLLLRGVDIPDLPSPSHQHTISRQHILPPDQRTRENARKTALKMLQDCGRRLRKRNLWAGGLGLAVFYLHHDHAFEAHRRIPPSHDALSLQQHFLPLWEGSPNHTASGLCVFLTDLQPPPDPASFRRHRAMPDSPSCRPSIMCSSASVTAPSISPPSTAPKTPRQPASPSAHRHPWTSSDSSRRNPSFAEEVLIPKQAVRFPRQAVSHMR